VRTKDDEDWANFEPPTNKGRGGEEEGKRKFYNALLSLFPLFTIFLG